MTGVTLPRPLVDDGVVTIDSRSRTLTVRPAPDASATVKVLWRAGVHAQARRPQTTSTVWAAGAGKRDIPFGLPAGTDALKFRFRLEDPVYRRLVSTPGLRARIAVDRASRQILSVTFRGKA